MSRIAGPPYRTAEQWHGPCYILSPDDWVAGWREVIAVLPPIQPKPRRARIYARSRPVATQATRTVAVWPKGRPLDWRLVDAPVMRREPGWYTRAREMRARGLSVRSIMKALHLRSRHKLELVLRTTE
jgi:hypothetical protein